jgi:hypothetical protein
VDRKTKQLVKQLESEDPRERYLAAGELAKRRAVETLSVLDRVATLDANPKVRDMAYKAVRFLTVLKDEMDQEELRRRIEEQDADEDDDATVAGWSDIDSILQPDDTLTTGKIKTMEGYSSVFTADEDTDQRSPFAEDDDDAGAFAAPDDQRFQESFEPVEYSNIDLGLYPDLRLDDEPLQPEPTAPPEEDSKKRGRRQSRSKSRKNKRRSTFRYRILLWLSVSVAIMALALVLSEEFGLDDGDTPQNRQEALDGLETWREAMVNTANRYFTATVTVSEFDCAAYTENTSVYTIPERPDWAAADGEFQEGLDNYFDGMETAGENLTEVKRLLDTQCERAPERAPLPTGMNDAIRENLTQTLTILNTRVLSDLNAAERDLNSGDE